MREGLERVRSTSLERFLGNAGVVLHRVGAHQLPRSRNVENALRAYTRRARRASREETRMLASLLSAGRPAVPQIRPNLRQILPILAQAAPNRRLSKPMTSPECWLGPRVKKNQVKWGVTLV